jgi:hypothetical protein
LTVPGASLARALLSAHIDGWIFGEFGLEFTDSCDNDVGIVTEARDVKGAGTVIVDIIHPKGY